jgi:hypothetical protein
MSPEHISEKFDESRNCKNLKLENKCYYISIFNWSNLMRFTIIIFLIIPNEIDML